MSEPWHGSAPPDTPVSVTLPHRTFKRVLDAVYRSGFRLAERGGDPVGVELMAQASAAIGDALAAPPNRRFTPPRRYAVVAVDAADYAATLRALDLTDVHPVWVDSPVSARETCYVGYVVSPAATYRLANLPEVLEVIARRTFQR